MAATDAEPRAGALALLRRGESGSSPGLHLVVEPVAGVDGVWLVEPVTVYGQRFKAPFADFVWFSNPVHKAVSFNLDPRPPAKVAATAPLPPPASRTVTIHVTNRASAIEFVRHGSKPPLTVHYEPGSVVGVNQGGQPIMPFKVDERDQAQFLHSVPNAFLPGQKLAPQFSGEE